MVDRVELESEDLELILVVASDDEADVVVETVEPADEVVWLEVVVVEALDPSQLESPDRLQSMRAKEHCIMLTYRDDVEVVLSSSSSSRLSVYCSSKS